MFNFGKHGNIKLHRIDIIKNPVKDKRKRRKCNCGCNKKSEYALFCNGVCLATGCQLYLYRFNRKELVMQEERKVICQRATVMAKKVLKHGDIICSTMCCGVKRWFKFSHFDGDWICSTGNVTDCHAMHIYKVNGVNKSFFQEARKDYLADKEVNNV